MPSLLRKFGLAKRLTNKEKKLIFTKLFEFAKGDVEKRFNVRVPLKVFFSKKDLGHYIARENHREVEELEKILGLPRGWGEEAIAMFFSLTLMFPRSSFSVEADGVILNLDSIQPSSKKKLKGEEKVVNWVLEADITALRLIFRALPSEIKEILTLEELVNQHSVSGLIDVLEMLRAEGLVKKEYIPQELKVRLLRML